MGTKKMIIYILIGFLASAAVFGGVYYFTIAKEDEVPVVPVEVVYKTYEHNLGEFTTNLGSPKSYFKGEIVIETLDETLSLKIPEKSVAIRDSIISTIIGRTATELLTPDGQESLKKEILESLTIILSSDKITNVFFNDYIIQ